MIQEQEYTFLLTLNITLSIFSILSSLIVLFLYIYLTKLRNFSLRLIVHIQISLGLFCIGNFFGGKHSEQSVFCYFQSIFLDWFSLSSVLWVYCISFTNFHYFYLQKIKNHLLEKIFIIFCYGISILFVIISLALQNFGSTSTFCWFKNQNWEYLNFYLPLWFSIIFNFISFFCVFLKYYFFYKKQEKTIQEEFLFRNYFYLFYFSFANFFPTINRLYNTFIGNDIKYEIFTLHLIHILTTRSIPIIFMFIFILNKYVIFELKLKFKKYFLKFKNFIINKILQFNQQQIQQQLHLNHHLNHQQQQHLNINDIETEADDLSLTTTSTDSRQFSIYYNKTFFNFNNNPIEVSNFEEDETYSEIDFTDNSR